VKNNNAAFVLIGIKLNAIGTLFESQFKCLYCVFWGGFTGTSVSKNEHRHFFLKDHNTA
jgi:hypothetical protein